MAKHHMNSRQTYDEIDDKILAMLTQYPSGDPRRPSFNAIRKKIPRANHSRCMRAVWRSKREATMKPKLHAVEARTTSSDTELLSSLRSMVQEFVQKVSTHPDPIQDMTITITTPKGTVSVRMSQEVKPAERE